MKRLCASFCLLSSNFNRNVTFRRGATKKASACLCVKAPRQDIFFSLCLLARKKKKRKRQTTTRVYLYREVERRILQTDARFSGGYGVTGTATHSR